MKFFLPLFCLICLGPSLANADYIAVEKDKDWRQYYSLDGLKVYVRKRKGPVDVRVVGEIDISVPELMSILRDAKSAPSWVPDMLTKKVLSNIGDGEAITYSITDMPWPLYDRFTVLHNKLYLDKKSKILYVSAHSVDAPLSPNNTKGMVRAYVKESYMAFVPIAKQRSYIDFMVSADPKGAIPTWVVNYYQKKWPISFLKALERYGQKYDPPPLRAGLKQMLGKLLKVLGLPADYFSKS